MYMSRYEMMKRNISVVISMYICRIHYSLDDYFFNVRVAKRQGGVWMVGGKS